MKHNISYLFLRGLTRNYLHWKERETYEKHLENKVYFLDPPGFGRNHKLKSPANISEITNYIKSVWDSVMITDPDSKKVIVGLSLGGMVALDWMSRFEKDWDGAVIINSSVSNLSWPWERFMAHNALYVPRYFSAASAKAIESIIFDATCNLKDERNQLVADWAVIRKKYPYKKISVINQLLAASRFKAPAAENIKSPALILTSRKDRLVSYKCSEAIAHKYKFNMFINEVSGHDLAVDDDLWMLQHIKDFAEKL